MMSRLYKAYGGPVVHPPGYMDCLREVEALPKFKGLTWYKSLVTRATAAQEEEKRRLIAECMKKRAATKPTPEPQPFMGGDIGDLGTLLQSLTSGPYLLPALAILGLLLVGVLVGKAIK